MNQFLYIILATLLLSTILISYYTNTLEHTESGKATMYRLQGERIADRIFQMIDAKIDNGSLDFDNLKSSYNNKTYNEKINDVTYISKLKVYKCNEVGDTTKPKNDFLRMDIWITASYGDNNNLKIGTQSNALKKIFSNTRF